jgi:FG-GAP repeat protein
VAGPALVSVRGRRFVRPMGSLAVAAIVAAGGLVGVGVGGGVASAAAGCVAADMYAHHTVVPADATGGAAVAGAKFGAAVVTGDFNKDGKADVAIGAPNDSVGGAASGSVSVFLGSATGISTGKRLTQADAGASDEAGDQWGAALAAGDFNKDGFTDLAVGAPGEAVGSIESGGISVFPGSASGLTTGQGFTQETGGGANEAGDKFGAALAAADFNGDTFADLAIGVPGEVPGGETAKGGAVFVYKGSASGVVSGWATMQEDSGGSTEADDEYGAALAAGNVTGTSHADLVVGAPGEAVGTSPADGGGVYVVPGSSTGTSTGFERFQADAGGASEGGDRFGEALAVANVDKDTFADVAVGVPGEAPGSAPAGGSLMIFPGASTEVAEGFSVQESQGGEAITTGDKFGATLTGRDVNADGYADLLVGAPGKTYGSVTAAGASFLYNGAPRDSGSTVSVKLGRRITQPDVQWSNGNNNAFGSAGALADITGDGKPEAVIGAQGEPPSGQPASGSAVVLTNLAPGAAPSVPLESFSPTAAMQASLVGGGSAGPLEYAYVNNVGQLFHAHQTDLDDFSSVQYTAISRLDEAFAGRPSLAEQADGRLQVVAHETSSNVWVNTQATKDPAVWGSWLNTGGLMASHTTIARQADGTLVVFAIDGNGVLWALHQPSPNATHTAWMSMGVTGLTGTPVAVPVGSEIRVFARDTSGDIKTALYADRTLSGCIGLGGSGLTGTPAVVRLPGSTMWVFARAADGSIVSQKSDSTGVFPGTWNTVGSFTAAGSPSALLSPSTSMVEIVARAADGIVYSTGETAQGSGEWREWKRAIPPEDPTIAATDPTAFTYTTGSPTWAYVIRNNDNVNRVYVTNGTSAARSDDSAPTFTGHTLPAPPAKSGG